LMGCSEVAVPRWFSKEKPSMEVRGCGQELERAEPVREGVLA
jgi:hypothetical protein